MREPHVVADPTELLEVLDRTTAVVLKAVGILLHGLRKVGVEPHAATSGELGGFGHEPFGDRERRARRDGDPHHRFEGGVVEPGDRCVGCLEDRVGVLHDVVGR